MRSTKPEREALAKSFLYYQKRYGSLGRFFFPVTTQCRHRRVLREQTGEWLFITCEGCGSSTAIDAQETLSQPRTPRGRRSGHYYAL